mmetsp:Transcript_25386/g.66427  ORF Transcript_25386/g.66427 Transcript_25386/m.66427 type:complete len:300 (-) Transcript_25386:2448-3347(-)
MAEPAEVPGHKVGYRDEDIFVDEGRGKKKDKKKKDKKGKGPNVPFSTSKLVEYFGEITYETIMGWDSASVVAFFLTPLKLDNVAGPLFKEHRINGPVLLAMSAADVEDLCGPLVNCVAPGTALPSGAISFGDRCFMIEALQFIQKKQARVDTETTLFHVKVPEGGLQYYGNCCECLAYTLCPCIVQYEHYRLKATGMEVTRRPAKKTVNMFSGLETNFRDFRFLKKVDQTTRPCVPFCCWKRHGISFVFYTAEHGKEHWSGQTGDQDTFVVWHPTMQDKAESQIRQAWSAVRLVSMPGM